MLLYSKNPGRNHRICIQSSFLLLALSFIIGLFIRRMYGTNAAIFVVLFINTFSCIDFICAKAMLNITDPLSIEKAWKMGRIYKCFGIISSAILILLILGWKWMLAFALLLLSKFMLIKRHPDDEGL